LITQDMADAGVVMDWAYQPALHLQPVFRSLYGTAEGLLPITEDILSRHLCLPCHPRMTDEDAIYVVKTFKDVIINLDKNRTQQ
jgi:dTDP-4-amino-4,6-dideoxygalactose transaminase